MTIGVISYLSARGLGTMAHDLRKQLGVGYQLVLPDGDWPYVPEWANGNEIYLGQWEIQRNDLALWKEMDKIDTVVAIETGYGENTFRWCKELGIRTVLIVMWEQFHPRAPAYQDVDMYICPSWKAYQEIPFDNRLFLPWPVDTKEFQFRHRTGQAKTFVHNAGSGGMNGRKGTLEAIEGFIKADVPGTQLIVRSQVPFHQVCPNIDIASPVYQNVKIDYGSKPTRAELYETGDVLIYTSHYDGHSLVGIEAMASGMPLITTDAEPMNELLKPGDKFLVKVRERKFAGTVNPHCLSNLVDIDDLAEAIRYAATTDMSDISMRNRHIAEREHSWLTLRDRWKQKLGIQ